METSPTSLSPQTLAKLKSLRLRAKHIVEGYVSGLHRSPYHGFSIEFAEHREYTPGDDLRYVDWKVFGRTDKFYVKQYEDETNLLCYLVVDISESMRYQSGALSKLEYAQSMAAALAWLVLHQQDAVGLATFDDQVRRSIPPSSNSSHLQQILQVLEQVEPRAKTSLGKTFHELAERFKKRGVVVILSDLFDDPDRLLAGLKHFRYRRHDVILLHIMDPAELEFPFDRPTLFKGLESLPDVTADPRSLRRAYLAEIETYLRRVKEGCLSNNLDYQLVRTDQPFDTTLSNHLSTRAARLK